MKRVFSGVPDHWCQTRDEVFSNCTESQTKALTIPKVYKDGESVYSQCQRFSYNYSQQDVTDYCTSNASLPMASSDFKTVSCGAWHYDTSVYSDNIVTEVNFSAMALAF